MSRVVSRATIARRRARLVGLAERLPEVVVRGDQHLSFAVRGKTFAYYLDDHHGDGLVALACKAPPGLNTHLAGAFPDRFYIPAYVGPRGWLAVRLDLPRIDWDELDALLVDAYGLTAPKRLADLVEPPDQRVDFAAPRSSY